MYADYVERLGLKWPVEFEQNEQGLYQTCSSPAESVHRIAIPREPFLPDVVHELCRAAIGERVDVAFATLYFPRMYGEFEGAKAELFCRKANELRLAWSGPSDLWADDLRHSLWPELTAEDHSSFARLVNRLISAGRLDLLRTPEGMLGIALQRAFAKRHDLQVESIMEIIVHSMAHDSTTDSYCRDLIGKLEEALEHLPRLKYERVIDVPSLEEAVASFAGIFGFAIEPRLSRDDDRYVWRLGGGLDD